MCFIEWTGEWQSKTKHAFASSLLCQVAASCPQQIIERNHAKQSFLVIDVDNGKTRKASFGHSVNDNSEGLVFVGGNYAAGDDVSKALTELAGLRLFEPLQKVIPANYAEQLHVGIHDRENMLAMRTL